MNVERLRRKPGSLARAVVRAGVVLGAIFTVLLAGSPDKVDIAGGNIVAPALADDIGQSRAAELLMGHQKDNQGSTLKDLPQQYQVSSPVPGITPPAGGQHDGKDVPQPINFSHKIHAGDNGINCMYCHTYARRSKVSGIPPTSKCMGCHSVIATDKPEIQKLTKMWEEGTPPQWKKVHDLPDFVHFTHQRHLKRFLFDNPDMAVEDADQVCAMCHGEVKTMTVAKKSKSLTMGFCVNCHQANNGPADCWKCHK